MKNYVALAAFAVLFSLSATVQAQSTTPDSVCVGTADVVYGIQGASSSSTFNWWLGTPSMGTIDNTVSSNNSTIEIDWGSTSGSVTLYVQETTVDGCVGDTASLEITLNDLPTVAVVSDSVCEGYSTTVTLTLTGQAPWSVDYTTDGGSTTTNAVVNSSPHTISFPGMTGTLTFEVVGVTDDNSCAANGSMPSATMYVYPQPAAPTIFHY